MSELEEYSDKNFFPEIDDKDFMSAIFAEIDIIMNKHSTRILSVEKNSDKFKLILTK